MRWALVPFALGVVASLAVLAGLVATRVRPDYRFWPPGDDDRKLRRYLLCSRGLLVSLLATAALDFGAGPLPWPAAGVAGGALLVVGLAVTGKAGADLGEEETRGRVGELRTGGLYRYSRNPQNAGYLLVFWGLAVLADSPLVAGLAALASVWLVLQAVVEEPWLREQYGEAYAEYRRETPRFVGIRSVRRALGRGSGGDD